MPTVATTFSNPDPDSCPSTMTELITLLNLLVTSTVNGAFSTFTMGSSIPAVNDQDKPWFKLDAQGRPLGAYKYYNGNWRRLYNVPVGTIVMFTGDPSGLFDGNGLGIVNTDWDGYQLCNGNNSSPNLSDKFVIAGRLDNVGLSQYSSGWQTNVGGSGSKTGGNPTITLTDPTTYRPSAPSLTVGRHEVAGEIVTAAASGRLYGTRDMSVVGSDIELVPLDEGNTDPAPITTLPPYYAVAFAVFLGYT